MSSPTPRVVPGVVAVSTTAVDPKVRNSAGAVTVAAFVTGVILSGLGRWHLFTGLDESTKRYAAGAVLALVTGATVWLVGFWTAHGEPILERAEAEAAAVIGPDELAAAVSDIRAALATRVSASPVIRTWMTAGATDAQVPVTAREDVAAYLAAVPTSAPEPEAAGAPSSPVVESERAPDPEPAAEPDPVLDLTGVTVA